MFRGLMNNPVLSPCSPHYLLLFSLIPTLSSTQVLVKLSHFQTRHQAGSYGKLQQNTTTKHYKVSCRVELDIVSENAVKSQLNFL